MGDLKKGRRPCRCPLPIGHQSTKFLQDLRGIIVSYLRGPKRERMRETAKSKKKKKKKGELMEQGSTFDLNVLPEECISNILSLTSPQDACRSSVVSSFLRSAADSDLVWERFLPSDIHRILSSSSSVSRSLPSFSSKKELFLHLCHNPLLIDRGTKTLSLEKHSGKKRYMIGARALFISLNGDTTHYQKWIRHPESRFPAVVEVMCIYYLVIRGKMETRLLSPNTTYGVYLVLKFNDSGYEFEPLAEVSVKLVSGTTGVGDAEEGEVKSVYLNPVKPMYSITEGRHRRKGGVKRGIFRLFPWSRRSHGRMVEDVVDPQPEGQVPKERRDGWREIEMGQFFNGSGEDGLVEMSLIGVRKDTTLFLNGFPAVVEVMCIYYLVIRGKMETRLLSPNTTYGVYLVLKFNDSGYEFEPLAEVSVKLVSGTTGVGDAEEGEVKSVYLNPVKPMYSITEGRHRRKGGVNRGIFRLFPWSRRSHSHGRPVEDVVDPQPEGQVPKERRDGWREIEMGQFFNGSGEDGLVEMSLIGVRKDTTLFLNGYTSIFVQGIEVRPKENH
ncbi:uncharacterized protein LOC122091572 [Macadamia integrifolia]|uniref:uncharacterized protein LOC122091572 n=1 Tax=Macadamia integrifolia TaxID=60698 RepID=UPI001C4FD982|nr:uncharacterized protein LOC122091572 [Macadamia integrifolia]